MDKNYKYYLLAVLLIYSSHMLLKAQFVLDWAYIFLSDSVKRSYDVSELNYSLLAWWMFTMSVYVSIIALSIIINSKIKFNNIGNKLISYLFTGFWIKQLVCFTYDGNTSIMYDWIDLSVISIVVALLFVKSNKWNENKSGEDIIEDDNVFYIVSENPKYLIPFLYSLIRGRDKPHKKIVYNGFEYCYNWRFKFVKRPYRDNGGWIESFNCNEFFEDHMSQYVGKTGSYSDPCEKIIKNILNTYTTHDDFEFHSRVKYLFGRK